MQPANLFLGVALPLGILLCFVTPPFQVPDEQAHFARAYQISEGGFLPEHIDKGVGGHLPKSLVDSSIALVGNLPGDQTKKIDTNLVLKELSRPLRPDDRTDIHFENTALYSPLMYAPSAAGIDIAKIFGATPLVMLYVGRLFTLLVSVGLIYLAIRVVSVAKWAFAVIALAPMAIFQAASVSADALTLAVSFVVVAWFVRLVMQTRTATSKEWLVTMGLLLLLGFIKQPYALLGLVFVALPARQFVSAKLRWQFIGSALVALGCGTVCWYVLSKGFFAQSPFMLDRILQPDAQTGYIFSNPLHFIKSVLYTHLTSFSDGSWTQMVGVFGWLDAPLPLWSVLLYLGCLVTAVGQAYGEKILPLAQRLAIVGVAAGVFLAIDTLLFIYWNVGNGLVGGIQGRYYLMLLPAVALVLAGSFTVKFKKLNPQLVIMSGMAVVLCASLFVIVNRFY